jgi:hypothetical protein
LINNQSLIDSRSQRGKSFFWGDSFFFKEKVISACSYGRIECHFGATCTIQDECQCIFNCNETEEVVQDETTGINYPNKCRLNEARCNSYYQPLSSKKGM